MVPTGISKHVTHNTWTDANSKLVRGVIVFLKFVPIDSALTAFLIALEWKCGNLLGKKQSKFTEMSIPLKTNTLDIISTDKKLPQHCRTL